MYRYMKPTLMLATPIVVYFSIYAVAVVSENDVFNYLAVYMAACSAMLMLFVSARHTDDYKSALAAVAFGASLYFASAYFIQLLGPSSYQQASYGMPVAVTPAPGLIQRWLLGQREHQPQQMLHPTPQQTVASDSATEPAAPAKAQRGNG